MDDPKVSFADRGWIKNETRHIKNKNRDTVRLPRNSRNSIRGESVLAHKPGLLKPLPNVFQVENKRLKGQKRFLIKNKEQRMQLHHKLHEKSQRIN